MLGMVLVLGIMAILVGSTLRGIESYKITMKTIDSKIDEMEEAGKLKADVDRLKDPLNGPKNAQIEMVTRLNKVRESLQRYENELVANLNRSPDATQAVEERDYIGKLTGQIAKVDASIRKQFESRVAMPQGAIDPLVNTEASLAIDHLNRTTYDLIDTINRSVKARIQVSRKEVKSTVTFLIVTSILAVLFMANLLRYFYRSVATPIRELEEGATRVSKGDFEHRIEIRTGDEIEHLAASFNDMTDRLREMYDNLATQVNERSRQLVRSERLAGVGFLAAGVAHEINNPLASIAFCSEAVESRLHSLFTQKNQTVQDQEVIAKYLKMIQEEAFRCKEITQKLLAFSRGGERKRTQQNLVEILQGVLDMVQHLQTTKGKSVVFKPTEPLLAWVNAQEVKQVFLNLVVNALESMDEGGELRISHVRRGNLLELVFRDTGCGMTPEVLENIFEPFFTKSRTGKGTGLGLSISHRIITAHGGEIAATSEGPNRGSTFVVRLSTDPPANAQEETDETALDPEEEFLKLSTARQNRRAA